MKNFLNIPLNSAINNILGVKDTQQCQVQMLPTYYSGRYWMLYFYRTGLRSEDNDIVLRRRFINSIIAEGIKSSIQSSTTIVFWVSKMLAQAKLRYRQNTNREDRMQKFQTFRFPCLCYFGDVTAASKFQRVASIRGKFVADGFKSSIQSSTTIVFWVSKMLSINQAQISSED